MTDETVNNVDSFVKMLLNNEGAAGQRYAIHLVTEKIANYHNERVEKARQELEEMTMNQETFLNIMDKGV